MRTLRPSVRPLAVRRVPTLAVVADGARRLGESKRTAQRKRVWLAQGGRCAVCGGIGTLDQMELDHTLALVDHGGSGDDNTQMLCVPCHAEKTAAERTARASKKRANRYEDKQEPCQPNTQDRRR